MIMNVNSLIKQPTQHFYLYHNYKLKISIINSNKIDTHKNKITQESNLILQLKA
jgi:hypothetical protein